ncbi:MAG: hypothetical protein BGO14_11795 [Chlamydiales bacterium 38-26]|nr:BON domain-containing protein [Chlamydiales bacterium]OJV11619.1 MAG: hypothetical protein BGO14_11795 [Chlamydiales bacterium 38-26]
MKMLGILSSTALVATAILGMGNAYGQCQGGYCPIPNAYFNQNAATQYGYDRPGNQNPNWQGNQSPDWRNDNSWRGGDNQYYQGGNNAYYRNAGQSDNSNVNYNDNMPSSNRVMNSNTGTTSQGYYYSAPASQPSNSNQTTENTKAGPDSLIQHRVEEALKNNYLKKNYKFVNVRIYNGTATLSGSVESEEDRQDVENRVRGITGVTNINDQLQVNPDLSKESVDKNSEDTAVSTDADLQKQVNDTLKGNYVKKNYESITATVANGVVNLTGTVESDKDRQEILERIQKIKGVTNIDDKLQVTGSKTSYNAVKRPLSFSVTR